MLLERGHMLEATGFDLGLAEIELKADNPAGAEAVLIPACDLFERWGASGYLSTGAAYLAEGLYRQGRLEEALQWVNKSASLSADDDLVAQISFRSVRAKLLARMGEVEDAVAIAQEVLTLADRTGEASSLRSTCLSDVAETFEIVGRSETALPLWHSALDESLRKGDRSSAERVRRRLSLAQRLPSDNQR